VKNTLSRVSFIVHENQKFQVSDRLLCTISGGQDSILNLIFLYHLESLYLFRLNLAYCNHFWQPTNFYTLFELFKFGYLINKPISNLVPKQRLLSEEEAHFWRQKNFYQMGTYLSLNTIILGHSLSDKIETSFWNFIRGSGPNGLISLKQNSFITNKNFKKVLAQGSLGLSPYKQKPKDLQPCYQGPLGLHLRCQGTPTHVGTVQGTEVLEVKRQGYSKLKSYEKKNQIKFLSRNTEQQKYFLKTNCQPHTFPCYSQNMYIDLRKVRARNDFKLNRKVQQYIYVFEIREKSRIKVGRPLLCFSRTMISKLINQNKLPRIIDTTNKSKKLIRNKFRLIILPLLNSYLQIKFQGNINKYLNIVETEQTYFSVLENSLMKLYFKKPLEIKYLSRVPLAIKQSILNTVLEHYMPNQVILKYITHIINFKS
jgi:tRNA(Ile)-lysidine synthase TilS/MesJ